MKKVDRLMGIICLLNQNKKLTSKQLAERLEVSERTIYRDIDALSQMKVPIISYEGFNGGYEIHDEYFVPSLKLNENEILYLLICLKSGDIIKFPNMEKDYESLRYKLLNILDEDIQKQYVKILERVNFLNNIYLKEYRKDIKETLLKSFRERKNIVIKYYSPRFNETFTTKLTPYILNYYSGAWSIYGYAHSKKECRPFRIDRIESIEILDDTYEQELIDDFLLKNGSEDEKITVILEMYNNIYDSLKSDRIFSETKIKRSDDKVRLEVKVDEKNMWIIRNIAAVNYDGLTVFEPESLIKELKEMGRKILEKY